MNNAADELRDLIQSGQPLAIEAFLEELAPGELASVVSNLSPLEQAQLLKNLDPEDAAYLVERLPEVQVAGIFRDVDPTVAAAIVTELWSDEQADLLGDLGEVKAEEILAAMAPGEAEAARELTSYPSETAGGLMVRELLTYRADRTVQDLVDDLRLNKERYADYEIQYVYVSDAADRLVGVLRMRDVLLATRDARLDSVMLANPMSVSVEADLEELNTFFLDYGFLGVPVVDPEGTVVGLVRRSDVQEALASRAERTYSLSQGIVGGEELRMMPLLLRSRRRLAWLSLNVILNLMAASIIAFYQDTLSQVIALAVFLPIISDMSGCSGSQAVAVSIRELSLGLVEGKWVIARVLAKEAAVGLINGAALGMLVGLAAFLWKGNPVLGAVVGGALAVNTVVSVCIGGSVPLALKRFGMDPALASGPILTTVTDVCGFFLVLSLATMSLEGLV